MISHKHKFIFIHAPKTAGNSIQNIIMEYSENEYVNKRYDSKNKKYVNQFGVRSLDKKFKIRKHTTLNTYYTNWRKKYGSIEDFAKFGTVRNPWDRAISFYFWEGDKSFDKTRFIKSLMASSCFDYFYVKKYDMHKLDYIIRFENLQEDFNIVCDKIGIPQQELPHANKSKHKHYTEYYDDETREIIAKRYAKDIEVFDYQFGD